MRLARLELFGFKSFLNRTVFQFNEGVTSIVGPNGCGKSNVVDAIIWALGERGTKTLRIKDMGDVIFHGSNGRRPVNIGEVSLGFQDGDGRDTAIKRRIYRDGANEYYLNGSQVRLKDIQDFFLGTGIGMNSYAIIEQGKIEYFIQMKPQERKIVVEETSGVTRFEEKKKDAIIRLEEVGANLERVGDIYREVVKNYEKSEEEWKRWTEYRVLADRLSEVDKWILLEGYGKLTRRIGKIAEREEDLQKEIVKKEEEILFSKEELEAKEKEFALVDQTIRRLEIDIKGQEKDMEARLLEIEYLKEEETRLARERTQFLKTAEELEGRILRLARERKEVEEKKAHEESLLKKAEEEELGVKETLAGLKAELEGFEKKIEGARTALFVSMSRLTEIRNRLTEIERIRTEKKKREERRQAELERLRERLDGLEEKQAVSKGAVRRAREEQATLLAGEGEALKERESSQALLQERRTRIEQLKGARRGKEEFIRQMRSLQGVSAENPLNRSKLIDTVRVEEEAVKAVERFFFKEMEYYVLTEEGAPSLAQAVEKHEGNYIFFPKQGMFHRTGGDISMDVKWVKSIEEALTRIEEGEEGIFINNSVCVDSRGFILREKEAKKVDLKGYRERIKAEKELKEITLSLDTESAALREIEAAHARKEARLREARAKREEKEKRINGLERDAIAVDTELRTVRERVYELETKVDPFEEPDAGSGVEELMAEKTHHEEEKGQIEQEMAALRKGMDSAKKVHDDTLSRWHQSTLDMERKRNLIRSLAGEKERKASLAENLGRDKAGAERSSEERRIQAKERAGKGATLEANYQEMKEASQRQVARYEELKASSGKIHGERHDLQEKGEALRKEVERIRSRKETLEKEVLILNEKRGTVTERLSTIYAIQDPSGLIIPGGVDFEAEREKITREIEAVGEVNFRAEKEYTELKERVAFLEQQVEDLKGAAESLRKTIAKIDTITREIFFETFETVNSAFKRFTETLFRGGKGYLAYNYDTGGIDMFVQPPGKKVARMEQLSGGEKALISLSFLLSLIDTKPSPFVLMDEIDAPLDDANLMSLMEIIKGMSQKTQVVFITHNRITMESSDTIYGITMEEEGISKIISVRL